MADKIRVMIVDDHEIVRRGLAAVLATDQNLSLVGEADNQENAVATALKCKPAVSLMDVRLRNGTGIEACREIIRQAPATRVIMLTSYPDDDAILAAIMAGATGYLLKEVSASAIIDGITTVQNGGSLLDPTVTGKVLRKMRNRESEEGRKLSSLTNRERNILELIAKGKTNKEIGIEISLSDKTVKNYVSSILSKLQLERRSAAAAFLAEMKPGDQFVL